MNKNRGIILTIIFGIYVIATVGGLLFYNYSYKSLKLSYPISLLLADVLGTIIVFIFSILFHNASVYDPYWSVQPPVILGIALIKCSSGSTLLGWLLFAVVLVWGIRLTANWVYTFTGLEYQDWRYTMLKEKTGKFYIFVNFLGIHLFPTLIVYLCILPAIVVIHDRSEFKIICIIFILLSLIATICQGIADFQMHRFRKHRTGTFIRDGLWKHSRHPNYACEILMWWGVGLASVVVIPQKWYLLAGALANTIMFLFVSIPMADKRQSRKPGYDEYKKSTRML